jgi:AcrR family transcriptional regulator
MPDINSKHTKRIIEAAVELFKTEGYEKVSVNDICKAAGVARSSFYLVFSRKKDIIEKMLADAIAEHSDLTSSIISAPNDFERMWVICCRYLSLAETFGPELSGSFFRLELLGEIDIIDEVHIIDEWVTKLAKYAQDMGIILSREPAEIIAPICVSTVYYTTYDWCKRKGSFSLRQSARRTAEAILNVAPEYRWTEEQYNREGK